MACVGPGVSGACAHNDSVGCKMPGIAVVGTQWGDEGKGKIVDLLSARADMAVRFQGGANAGHTVVADGRTWTFHIVPCGILHQDVQCIVGNGVVVDPIVLLDEIDDLHQKGVPTAGRILISDRANVVFSYHKLMDQALERLRGKGKIGTTGRGIGTAYVDKTSRVGVRMADFVDEQSFAEKLDISLREKNGFLTESGEQVDFKQVYQQYKPLADRLRPIVADTVPIINHALDGGLTVLFEGAQGTMLDVDYGTYPYVTSSHPVSGGACIGAGVGPRRIDCVVGSVKAYTTRVGDGPFPTEQDNEVGEKLRNAGPIGEYGRTTGRPRRCGWLDTVVVRYAAMLNGLDYLAVTRLDILDDFDSIPICTGYQYNGSVLRSFPALLRVLSECKPVYEEMPGWMQPTTEARKLEDLPKNARAYLDRLTELTGVPVGMVSVGPERGQTIIVEDVTAPRAKR